MPFDNVPLIATPRVVVPKRVTKEQVIGRAIELLETRGWCQHEAYSIDGRFCAIGALYEAGREHRMLASMILTVMWRTRHITGDSLPRFNDAPGRTKEEVIAVLRVAQEGSTFARWMRRMRQRFQHAPVSDHDLVGAH